MNLNPELWQIPNTVQGHNKEIESLISKFMAQMSLPQLIGQTIQAEINAVSPADIETYHLGAVLNAGGSFPNKNNDSTPREWCDTLAKLQGQNSIPLLWGTDAVHGHNNLKGEVLFPHNISLGAADDEKLTNLVASRTALALLNSGIKWTFAPAVSVPHDLRWGRTYEGYSSDTLIVQKQTRAFVSGLQFEPGKSQIRLLATLKHFIGDGGTVNGIDQGDTVVTEDELARRHGPPYSTGIETGARVVMASFSSWQGEQLHGHSYLLTQILKKRLGFTGFVVGDWNGHKYLPNSTVGDSPEAMNAGIDMYMVPHDWKQLHHNLQHQVRNGYIPRSRLEDAVRRILRVKAELGLIPRNGGLVPEIAEKEIEDRTQQDVSIAHSAIEKSMVLIKNDDATLPIRPTKTILVAGKHAISIPLTCGGWSLTWQGTGTTNDDFQNGSTVLDGIKTLCAKLSIEVVFSETGDFSQEERSRASHLVMAYGETPYAEMEGDLVSAQFNPEQKDLLKTLKSFQLCGLKIVSLFFSGRPLWMNSYLNSSDAFVAAWLPGTQGAAVAACLFGKTLAGEEFEFNGKLSFPWPSMPSSTAVDSGDHLFDVGYGLTYASQNERMPILPEAFPGSLGVSNQMQVFSGRGLNGCFLFYRMEGGFKAVDEGTPISTSAIVVDLIDDKRQNDARLIEWKDSGSAIFRRAMPLNLRRKSEDSIVHIHLRMKVISGLNNATLHVFDRSQPRCIKLSDMIPIDQIDDWKTVKIPIENSLDLLNILELRVVGHAQIALSKCEIFFNAKTV